MPKSRVRKKAAYTQVTRGTARSTSQAASEEPVSGPPPESADARQPVDDVDVGGPRERREVQATGRDLVRDADHVLRLPLGELHRAELPHACAVHVKKEP